MRKKIQNYIENCLTCVMSNEASNRREGEISLYPLPAKAMEIFHVDHFGPLPKTPEHCKYILVIVDAFTHFMWLTKSTTSRETIQYLKNIFTTFGKPDNIVSDRGIAFLSKEFAEFTQSFQIKHRMVAVAAPWANGMVGRINRFSKKFINKTFTSFVEIEQATGGEGNI